MDDGDDVFIILVQQAAIALTMRVKIAMRKREQFFFGLLKPARCQFLQGTVVFLYAHKNHIVIFRQQREIKKLELFLDIRCPSS